MKNSLVFFIDYDFDVNRYRGIRGGFFEVKHQRKQGMCRLLL
ncbi:hypothetical protein [Peribacillus simplex]